MNSLSPEAAETPKNLEAMAQGYDNLVGELARMDDLKRQLEAELAANLQKVEKLSPLELQLPVDGQPHFSEETRRTLRTIEDVRTKLSLLPACVERLNEAKHSLRDQIFGALDGINTWIHNSAWQAMRELKAERARHVRRMVGPNQDAINRSLYGIEQDVETNSIASQWRRATVQSQHSSVGNPSVSGAVRQSLQMLARFKAGQGP